jgi:hypothetical protein
VWRVVQVSHKYAKISSQLHAPATLPWGKNPLSLVTGGYVGPNSRSGRYGEVFPNVGNRTPIPWPLIPYPSRYKGCDILPLVVPVHTKASIRHIKTLHEIQTSFSLRRLYCWIWLEGKKTPWSESSRELHRPSDRRLSAKWLPTFAKIRCHVVSVTSLRSYSRFSRQEPLLFYQVSPQLYSRG